MTRPHPVEVGELHYGIEQDGKAHKSFAVGPLSVADWFAMEAKPVVVEEKNSADFTRYVLDALSRRLLALGDIPRSKLTPSFLQEHLAMPDLSLLVVAMGRLDARLESFRQQYEAGTTTPDGAGAADGVVTD